MGCFVCGRSLGELNSTGACSEHAPVAFECVVPGCTARVAAYSRSKLCRVHRKDCGLRRVRKVLGIEGIRSLPVEGK